MASLHLVLVAKITVRAPADVGVKARGNITVEYDPANVAGIQPNHGPMLAVILSKLLASLSV